MGSLLVQCSACGNRVAFRKPTCVGGNGCGIDLTRAKGKVFVVRWRNLDGQSRQKKIGPSRIAAEEYLRQIESQLALNIYIDRQKDRNQQVTLKELFRWFLNEPDVRELDSFKLLKTLTKSLSKRLSVNKPVSSLSTAILEDYKSKRLQDESPVYPGRKITPRTVQEELHCLRNAINRAVMSGFMSSNPIQRWPVIKVHNVRDRILSDSEWARLQKALPKWLWRIVFVAYHTGMRQNELMRMRWIQVDLKKGFVRLKAEDTKTEKNRIVRLIPEVVGVLRQAPRSMRSQQVFLSATGKPLQRWTSYVNRVWLEALEQADIQNFRFHDLRHTFVTRAMRAGNPAYLVMKQVGHRTESMLKRYHLIDESDLLQLAFPSGSSVGNAQSPQ